MTKQRTPYAERPDIVAKHCTCLWNHWIDENGEHQQRMHIASSTCPLHGNRVEHDVPEAW